MPRRGSRRAAMEGSLDDITSRLNVRPSTLYRSYPSTRKLAVVGVSHTAIGQCCAVMV